ncbi:MAG: serine/threonine protein kinase [Planctomycetes bacterium]|nr:serine/threonine protein kinase [Planctomycetota bacterium]
MTKTRDFIGPYRLARLIRVGNSCAVWEAVKEPEGERFALKVLRQDLRDDRKEISFLKHEYDVAHKLRHPNIIRIHDFNSEGNIAYLVLELYSEQNMKLSLRQGVDQWAFHVPKIVEQSAEALYHVHQQGWVHCDVKPDNLLVSPSGDVKLIDFTIAERVGRALGGILGFGKKVIRGTRSYMSPEQIRGTRLDARSDIYSFGCVVFEMLSGRPPYTGVNPDELLEKHLHAAVPTVQAANNNVTNEGAELIRRMMAKKADQRPDTMWEFVKEFRTVRLFKKPPRRPGSSSAATDGD